MCAVGKQLVFLLRILFALGGEERYGRRPGVGLLEKAEKTAAGILGLATPRENAVTQLSSNAGCGMIMNSETSGKSPGAAMT